MEAMKRSVIQIYTVFLMLVQYFIPLTVLALTYGRIGYVIWIQTIPGEAVQTRDERMASSKRKVLYHGVRVTFVLCICGSRNF